MKGTLTHLTRVSGRVALFLGLAIPLAAQADEHAATAPALGVELNRTDTNGAACRLTFVVRNAQDSDVDQMVLETVLFTTDGQVALMTLFDFGALPAGVPRVRQFAVPDVTCDTVQSVLINGVSTCTMAGAASPACQDALEVKSSSDVELLG